MLIWISSDWNKAAKSDRQSQLKLGSSRLANRKLGYRKAHTKVEV